jgi:hypothetical protein
MSYLCLFQAVASEHVQTLRPLRPVDVRVILAAPPVAVPAYDNAPGDPEAWTAAALMF